MANTYGVSQGWISKLLPRYRAEGEAACDPHSRRPVSNPNATSPARVELVTTIRARLLGQGLDAGADSIRWHLQHTHEIGISRATIHHILGREGLVIPATKKAVPGLLRPLRRRALQPVLAGRPHPLPAHRRHRGRDLVLHR